MGTLLSPGTHLPLIGLSFAHHCYFPIIKNNAELQLDKEGVLVHLSTVLCVGSTKSSMLVDGQTIAEFLNDRGLYHLNRALLCSNF